MIKKEQFSIETQKLIDNALELVTASIQSVEKLTHIQLETSRQILEETSKAVKDLTSTNNPKDLFDRINHIASHTVEKNLASARDVYDVVSEVQAKISKVTEENVQQLQQNALESVDGLAQYNPEGSKLAADALKNWINSANQALATMTKVSAQFTEFTNSNLNAATTATVDAVKKTVKK
ncbi:MAG: hypothetical protein RLZZ293_842 [Pseudomonadota bacterium]|jgi:phasin family protein